jgi:hypothetical protein
VTHLMLAQSAVLGTTFTSLVLYVFAMIAFVGLFTGTILAGIWAVRCALGLEPQRVKDEVCMSRAVTGFSYILAGMAIGALLVGVLSAAPFLAVAFVLELAFGGDPPPLIATLGLTLLVGISLAIGVWFARWWQRMIWTRLPA